ncbi:retrovirus-related pol polyprotein from transposon TNT 1-94 [Tanacetum coccineum]|uniref:Retrovirus-related pol polyprotein from transposon TNT 1-94 n=1 Tax=Tanacetum coccineum TaxID=301880 RepID=A0ABQ5DV14_9ASTR
MGYKEEIMAQCALEELEVVEHQTVDADYESEIKLPNEWIKAALSLETLATELEELLFHMPGMLNEGDESPRVLGQMRTTLEERLALTIRDKEFADTEKLQKELRAQEALTNEVNQMKKAIVSFELLAYMFNSLEDIKERFSVTNGPRIQQLKSELAGCRQEGLSIVSYYGKLKVIWDELINYEQFPLCKCGKCVCDIAGKLEKKREEERVHQFFMGLEDKTYGQTRSNLLVMDPLPTLNKWGDRPKFEGKGKGTMTQQQKPNPPGGRGRGGQPRANAASVSGALELGNINGETLQALVNLLNSQKSSNENMTGLPNGDQAVATKSGIVNLDGKIKLLNDYTSRIQIGAGELREGLYYFCSAAFTSALKKLKDVSFDLWHKRLGHPSAKIAELLPDVGSRSTSNLVNKVCDVCLRAKQSRDHFPISENKATDIFELIHCDLWGGYRTLSSCGASYFLTIVDDYSRAVWIYLLKNKTEAPLKLLNFFAMVERQYNKKVKIVRSDNGTEIICLNEFFFLEHGIMHETSCTGTPQQNGRVERKHRHILNVARALRFQANLPIDFWGECVLTAGYLINRTPSMVLKGKTPYELLDGKPPSYDNFRVFGCLCYVHNQTRHGDKFSSKSRRCIFVGYPYGKKGWRVYDLELGVFLVLRDIVFSEMEFPYMDNNSHHLEPISSSINVDMCDDSVFENNDEVTTQSNSRSEQLVAFESGAVVENSDVNQNDDVSESNNTNSNISSSQHDVDATVDVGLTGNIEEEHLGRGQRNKRPSVHLKDHVLYAIQNKAIESKWVFKIKYNSDGTIKRHKARLVILGNNQVEGIDYNETFAPVAKMVTVRTFLSVAAARNWELHQMDVHNAFLHVDLKEEVYMKLPQGLKSSRSGTACHL